MQDSAAASASVELCSAETSTRPVPAIVKFTTTRPASEVGVYLAGFDEVADVFAAAAADPVLASVRWYGADGIAQSGALLTKPTAVAFAETVGFPSALFGLDFTARQNWQPVANRIQARAGSPPDRSPERDHRPGYAGRTWTSSPLTAT